MPRNEHEKEVVYESFEGVKTIYVTSVVWKDSHILVRHYPDENNSEFLHEDRVGGIYPCEKKIPLHRVYSVNDIQI